MSERFIDCPKCTKPHKVPINAVYCDECKSELIKIEITQAKPFITHEDTPQSIRVELTNRSIRELDITFESKKLFPSLDPDPAQAWITIPQGRTLHKDRKVPFTFTFNTGKIGRPTAEAIISVKVAGIPNVPEELVPPIVFSVGPPPKPELVPDKVNLGTVYIGGKIESKATLRNSGGGQIKLAGYRGTHVNEHTFSPPILIGANALSEYEITFPLETANLQPGPLKEEIKLRFEDGAELPFTIEGVLKQGPMLGGTVRWKQITEVKTPLGGDQQGFEYRYDESEEQSVNISINNCQILVNLGDIPKGVRASIELILTNDGVEPLMGKMSFVDGVKGITATFGGLREPSWVTSVEPRPGYSDTVIEIDTSQGVEGDGTYNLKAKLDYDKDYNLPQLSLDISFKLVPCQEYSDYVAADFGTTNSCIAYLLIAPGRPIAPAPVKIDTLTRYEHMGVGFRSGSGFNPHLYSFCCFGVGRDLGGPLVGCIAEREAVGSYENAKRSIRSIKTKLGTEWSKSIDGVQFKAQEVAEFIIRELIQKALDEVKMRPVKAIITVPANSSPKKIEETLTMYEKAGLGPLTREENLIYEPEAAAYYYILKHQEFFENFPEGQPFYIMTFDFGGGTLDVSVVRVKKEGGKTYIKVLASRAKNIGGDTIDWALREKVIQRTQRIPSQGKKEEKKEWYTKRLSELTSELSSLKDEDRSRLMGNRLNLLVECEQAKIELAMGAQSYQIKQQVADDVTLFPKDLEDVLTGQDVIPTNPKSSIITEAKGLIDETIMLASNVVAKDEPNAEKISPETIDVLFIVGGTSRIPLIENKIKEKFLLIGGRTRVEPAIEEAKTCVALGAAFYAYSRRIRARYQFSKARPKTEYRIGILDESFKFQEIFPTGTPFDSKPSTPNTMTMPPGGECAFLFALNRGTQNFAIGNPEIEILGERIFADTNAGASFDVTYQLSDTGYISANVNYQGGSRILQVPILDKMPEGKPEDDPGF